jgi:hypothetical protein
MEPAEKLFGKRKILCRLLLTGGNPPETESKMHTNTLNNGVAVVAKNTHEQPGREQSEDGVSLWRPNGEPLLTPRQVAKRLGVSVDWVQAMRLRSAKQ